MQLFGYPILTARDGQEGLEQFVANRSAVGVLLIDAHMPVMDGWELLETVRQENAQVPVIVSSGNADTRLAREAQANDDRLYFLHKPYTLNELKTMLQRVLAA